MDLAPFESPKLLIESAKENLAEFEETSALFVQHCHYNIIRELDAKTREQVVQLRFKERIPAKRLTLAHDIVNKLRNALDQAFCDAALVLGRPHAKSIYFPTGKSRDDLRNAIKDRCRNVNIEFVSFITNLEPYYGGKNAELWGLGRLAALKHQRLLGISLAHTAYGMVEGTIQGPVELHTNRWNNARNQLEFARIREGGHIKMQFTFSFEIVIDTADMFASQPAAAVFRQLYGKVERIILGIEAETARIKIAYG